MSASARAASSSSGRSPRGGSLLTLIAEKAGGGASPARLMSAMGGRPTFAPDLCAS
jgi:hypothetical protein